MAAIIDQTDPFQAMPNLPQEIIEEILSRLPVRSLAKFRCVSKLLRSLISDTHFIKLHLKQSRSRNRLFLSCRNHLKLQSLDFEYLINYDDDEESAIGNLGVPSGTGSILTAKILGSCDGLICLYLDKKYIILWNPSSGDCKILEQEVDLGGSSYGFGFDCSRDDYKLIRMDPTEWYGEINMDIFSLRNSFWRSVKCVLDPSFNLIDKMGTYVNGFIYWKAEHGGENRTASIVSLDLSKEKIEYRTLPNCGLVEGWMLGVLAGNLSACHCMFGRESELWVMKGNDWIKLGRVPQEEEPEYIRDELVPLCFAKNGEVVMLKGGLKINIYNLKLNLYRRLFLYYDQHEFDGVLYPETLVSPHCYDHVHHQTSKKLQPLE